MAKSWIRSESRNDDLLGIPAKSTSHTIHGVFENPKKQPWYRRRLVSFLLAAFVVQLFFSRPLKAQGGPPYYTNDPGTPGSRNWEINLGYMPFLYVGQSTTHVPDVDINYGLGDRIQLTYENAWLRVWNGSSAPRYGLGRISLA
jgi:hypothetical protein